LRSRSVPFFSVLLRPFPNSEHRDLSSSISRIVSRPLASALHRSGSLFAFWFCSRLEEERTETPGRQNHGLHCKWGFCDLRSNPKFVFLHNSCVLALFLVPLFFLLFFYCSPLSRNTTKPQETMDLAPCAITSFLSLCDFCFRFFPSVLLPSPGGEGGRKVYENAACLYMFAEPLLPS